MAGGSGREGDAARAWLAARLQESPPARIFAPGREHIGDVVNLTGPLRCLREAFPSAHIVAEVGERAQSVLTGFPCVDEVWARPTHQGAAGKLRHVLRLRRARFDLAVLLDDSNDLVLQSALGGIKLRVGIWRGKKYRSLFHALVPYRLEMHEVRDHGAEVVRLLGHPSPDPRPSLFPTEGDRADARALLATLPGTGPWIGVHPGASIPERRWSPERFGALVLALRDAGQRVVVLGGPADKPILEEVGRHAPSVPTLAPGLSILGFAALLGQLRLLVCHDSGPMHLAAAMGTPTVALYGPAYPSHTKPWGPGHIQVEGACACPLKTPQTCTRACIGSISVDRVVQTIHEALGE